VLGPALAALTSIIFAYGGAGLAAFHSQAFGMQTGSNILISALTRQMRNIDTKENPARILVLYLTHYILEQVYGGV